MEFSSPFLALNKTITIEKKNHVDLKIAEDISYS